MQPRWSFAVAVGAILLCLSALSACGFNKATDRIYTPANGINYRKGDVFVLNAVIAAAQPNSGTLIASMTNQTTTQTETLQTIEGGQGNTVQVGSFSPIKIQPQGFVDLAQGQPITISGQFQAGQVIPLSLDFENGKTITMDVPIVYACPQYQGLDKSQSSASDSATAAATSVSSGAVGSTSASPGLTSTVPSITSRPSAPPGGATPTPSDTSIASPTPTSSAYVCGSSGGTGGRN